jgi:hypothetical protein
MLGPEAEEGDSWAYQDKEHGPSLPSQILNCVYLFFFQGYGVSYPTGFSTPLLTPLSSPSRLQCGRPIVPARCERSVALTTAGKLTENV